MCRGAERRYFKGVRLLEDATLADDAEEERQLRLLLKLRLNRSQCLIKLCWPKKACLELQKALEMDGKNAKALFRMGRAKKMIGTQILQIISSIIRERTGVYQYCCNLRGVSFPIMFNRKSQRSQKVPAARRSRGPQRSGHQARAGGPGPDDS